jgi:hypothetical protein
MHLTATSTSTDAGTVAIPPIGLSADPVPAGWSPDRDVRIAGALRLRIARIGQDIADLEGSRERLTDALHTVETRIARSCWGRA